MSVLAPLRGGLRLLFILTVMSLLAAVLAVTGLALIAFPASSRRARAALVTASARAVLRPLGVRLHVDGPAPDPPFMLVCNHLGYMDILVLRAATGTEFISKAEIARWPVIGGLARLTGTLFLDRSNKRELMRINTLVADVLARQRGLTVFPEGTSTAGAQVERFHSGLLAYPSVTGFPVHAATLRYTTPPGIDTAHTVCWWGSMTFLDHLYHLLSIPHFDAWLSFDPNPVQAENRKALTARLHERVSAAFEPIHGAPTE
ncbi:MAG: 1-acyl-sn-glycerol-3-phosphate acyltransferase [Rhodothermales bacterium]|nr:1-acyl-sn-glycerol-3-phosphate acyltransferase [Rhodothermales bacterium]MBO6780498.1 1-acyl-sn-glycerol-3-phosphate acyltransferase [Rhodothermales bacterium]